VNRRTRAALALAGALVALPAPGPALAVEPPAGDLSGHLTVREVTSDPEQGLAKDVTVRWDLGGPLYASGWAYEAAATPSVHGYARRVTYTMESGETVCDEEQFAGWLRPPDEEVSWDMPKQDRLRNRAVGILRLRSLQSMAVMTSSDCGGANPSDPYEVPLIHDPPGTTVLPPRAVIGEGDWSNRAPTAYLAPDRIVMRRERGVWRSTGTQVREAPAGGADVPKRITIAWELSSRRPSRHCALPADRLVRGRTVAHARRVLRRAGLRPGRVAPGFDGRVRRGRAVGLLAFPERPGAVPCGTAVGIQVARG
jgi:hypothetical protein